MYRITQPIYLDPSIHPCWLRWSIIIKSLTQQEHQRLSTRFHENLSVSPNRPYLNLVCLGQWDHPQHEKSMKNMILTNQKLAFIPWYTCWALLYFHFPLLKNMTHSEYMDTLLSQDGHLWKYPESGCNRSNMVNIIHIYAKQCEIMQKNWWKSSNGQIHCFTRGNQLRGAKNMEN